MDNFLDILKNENSILLNQEADNWESAIAVSCEPLVKSGAIESRYIDSIIASTHKYGPYYLLMDGMAMPHSRPEDGVNRNAFSLVTFKSPISFPDGKEAQVFVVLAAISSEIHTSVAIPQIVSIFDTENIIERLVSCKSKKEIYDIISKIDLNQYLRKD
ncbi:PTS sugar transporter subunit IIA [Staphylococcus simulans]|uniref:PTS sugar transporter subunit IIA n=1 Tax=Staphylococcus simulans TaxID=1286 RepID=UPI000D0268E3|nr:PTS sugar transporter subunit IIA [Staphylococcus simulans]